MSPPLTLPGSERAGIVAGQGQQGTAHAFERALQVSRCVAFRFQHAEQGSAKRTPSSESIHPAKRMAPTRYLSRSVSKLSSAAQLLPLLASQVYNPAPGRSNRIETLLVALASADDKRRFLESVRASPELAALLSERWEPSRQSIAELAAYPQGTLAYAYARHMLSHGLSQDYYTELQPKRRADSEASQVDSDFHYVRKRLYEVHDVWHAVLGYGADLVGEMRIVGFYCGHFARYFVRDAGHPMVYPTLLCAVTLLHTTLFAIAKLPEMFAALVAGWQQGQTAAPFLPVKWEQMWHRNLTELRRELGVTVAA